MDVKHNGGKLRNMKNLSWLPFQTAWTISTLGIDYGHVINSFSYEHLNS